MVVIPGVRKPWFTWSCTGVPSEMAAPLRSTLTVTPVAAPQVRARWPGVIVIVIGPGVAVGEGVGLGVAVAVDVGVGVGSSALADLAPKLMASMTNKRSDGMTR